MKKQIRIVSSLVFMTITCAMNLTVWAQTEENPKTTLQIQNNNYQHNKFAVNEENEQDTDDSEDIQKSQDNNSDKIIIYVDALGNYVLSFPDNYNGEDLETIVIDETKEDRVQQDELTDSDREEDHTNSSGNIGEQELYGDAEWYNRKKNVALPGYTGCSGDNDTKSQLYIPKGTKFNVTNPDTGKQISVTVNDFGPQQNTSLGKKTIVDLDDESFTTLFGSTSVGRHVCTTYIEVKQYFN